MKTMEVKGGAYDVFAMCGGDIEFDPEKKYDEVVDYKSPSNSSWRKVCDLFNGLNAGSEVTAVINRILGREELENIIKLEKDPLSRDLYEDRLTQFLGISKNNNGLDVSKKHKQRKSI